MYEDLRKKVREMLPEQKNCMFEGLFDIVINKNLNLFLSYRCSFNRISRKKGLIKCKKDQVCVDNLHFYWYNIRWIEFSTALNQRR